MIAIELLQAPIGVQILYISGGSLLFVVLIVIENIISKNKEN